MSYDVPLPVPRLELRVDGRRVGFTTKPVRGVWAGSAGDLTELVRVGDDDEEVVFRTTEGYGWRFEVVVFSGFAVEEEDWFGVILRAP